MKAKEVMTKKPESLSPEATIREAAKRMQQLDIGILAICDNNKNKLTGAITDRDIVLKLAEGADPDKQLLKDFGTKKIHFCFQEDDINKISELMEKEQIHRVFILDNENSKQLVGIISMGDIAKKHENRDLCGEIVTKISEDRQKRKAA